MIECLMLCIASVLCICFLKKCHKKTTTTPTALMKLHEEDSYLDIEIKDDDENYDSLLDYV